MRIKSDGFRWEGVEPRPYKHGGGFEGVTRYKLTEGLPATFELRYFELAPGGYSSLEKHRHVHFLIVLRGNGKALVGAELFDLEPLDALYVPPLTAHRFMNGGEEPFGFLCPVDAVRDRPQSLDDAELEALRSNPRTAQYVLLG